MTTLAYLYNEEGDTTRAAAGAELDSGHGRSAKLYSALGYTYEQQKQYKKAIEAYRKAIELDHDNLDAIRGLAQNLMNDGQTDAALEQYKVIADADPVRCADLYAHGGDLSPERQVRPGAGELEEGRRGWSGLAGSALQHGRRSTRRRASTTKPSRSCSSC